MKKLDDLPPLADLSDWETLRIQLNLPAVEEEEVVEMAEITDLSVLYPQVDNEVNEDFDVDISEASKFIVDPTTNKNVEPEQTGSDDVRDIDAS